MHQVLGHAAERFLREFNGFDIVFLQAHPQGKPHLWTAQQVVQHLVLSSRATREDLERRLAKGRLAASTHRARVDWVMQLMVLSFGHMPVGVPAPENTVPSNELASMTARELADVFLQELELMDRALDQCRKQFGMERVAEHFLLGPMRVDQWRRYHVLHLRHHVAQLRRIQRSFAVEVVHAPAVAHA